MIRLETYRKIAIDLAILVGDILTMEICTKLIRFQISAADGNIYLVPQKAAFSEAINLCEIIGVYHHVA